MHREDEGNETMKKIVIHGIEYNVYWWNDRVQGYVVVVTNRDI